MIKLWTSIPCLMGYRLGCRLSGFLTHFFGPGLPDDNRYAVERFRAMAEGGIRRCPDAAPSGGSPRKAKAITATLKAVKEMRPAPNEIIVCVGQGSPRHGDPYSP